MERKGAKPQPEPKITIKEESFTLSADALTETGKRVVAQVGDVALIETSFTVDMIKATPVAKPKGA